ncbi:hypothetical protein QFW96_12865 [Saccharopolyspora sp. TS4A08]|uniref:Cas10/Cmr2 second palm domain-containing protein n=1 Tax=Saccharopolyspora ipomoeae TaxID=3042027 RepID=A0ABT6PNK4_9PSEU|nr:hypothetical protein [Saccharopolyspora sp. TS4A08]MDI2029514.1 hypothetical protein [Saccharopolyspora sp. TS4A08]
MKTFLDVGVIRVQSWLTLAPNLHARRGASTMIRKATEPEAVRQMLRELGLESAALRCDEAGHIDGVIPLRILDDSKKKDVERHVVRHLQAKLPGASLKTQHCEGKDWLSAHHSAGSSQSFEWPAVVLEWPMAKVCDWCHRLPATHEAIRVPDDSGQTPFKDLCIGCIQRLPDGGYSTGKPGEEPGPEKDLLELLPGRKVPDRTKSLAELGEVQDNTHLATVYADGNAIGRLGRSLRKLQEPDSDATTFELPGAISSATWSSLIDAVTSIDTGDTPVLPIIAHLVGGDDVLVSVPAHKAWRFTRTLLEKFSEHLGTALNEAGLGHLETPSISAGVVIHHHTTPFADVIELADALLKHSKRHGRAKPALAWHDITHEGPEMLPGQPFLTLEDFQDCFGPLNKLFGLSASQRLTLLDYAQANEDLLLQQAQRLDHRDVIEPFITGPLRIAQALSIVRWWRSDEPA